MLKKYILCTLLITCSFLSAMEKTEPPSIRNWSPLAYELEDLNLNEVHSRFMSNLGSPLIVINRLFEQLLLAGLPLARLPLSSRKIEKLFLKLTGMNSYEAERLFPSGWGTDILSSLSLRGLPLVGGSNYEVSLREMLMRKFPFKVNPFILTFLKTNNINAVIALIRETDKLVSKMEPSKRDKVRKSAQVALLFFASQGQGYLVREMLEHFKGLFSPEVLAEAYVRAAIVGALPLMKNLLAALSEQGQVLVLDALNKALLWAASQGQLQAVQVILAQAESLGVSLNTQAVAHHVRTILERTDIRHRLALQDILGTGIELEREQRVNLEAIVALLTPHQAEITVPLVLENRERALPIPDFLSSERFPFGASN